VEFPRDSIICREDTAGKEMYILKSGMIDVYIRDNKVASISEPGAVFGEMALLLGEKRTATLKARNNVVLTKISIDDIKEIVKKQSDILTGLVSSLARKHYQNVKKINTINEILIEKGLEDKESPEKKMLEISHTKNELASLKREVSDMIDGKNVDFLDDIKANL
jgi:CRP-like cAMP-binding protein